MSIHSRIPGTGSYLPPEKVSNDDLAERLARDGIETSDAWIVERTGIRQRYFADPGTSSVDIVVCDGFVGNVALKTSEGVAQMISGMIREEFGRGLLSRVAALCALPVLRRVRRRADHRRYNGAALLGLRGLVFKSHGSADAFAFEQALERAREAVEGRVVQEIESILATLHAPPQPAGVS